MTQQNLVVDGKKGLVAVYSGPIDSDVEDNPLNHLDKTTFNSKLDYIGFTKITKTYTIPAASSAKFAMERINLGAHGKGFTPICFAVLKGWLNGDGNAVDLPLGGGVLLDFYGQRPGDSGVLDYEGTTTDRWSRSGPTLVRNTSFDNAWQEKSLLVGAGADGSNLFLWYEQCVNPQGGDGASYPAFALTIDFYVGDRSIDGSTGDPAPSALFVDEPTGVQMSSTRITATGTTDGGFDTDKRFFHADDTDPLLPVITSDAVDFSNGGSSPNLYSRDAIYYGDNWSFDLKVKSGSPTIPAVTVPTVKGLSV